MQYPAWLCLSAQRAVGRSPALPGSRPQKADFFSWRRTDLTLQRPLEPAEGLSLSKVPIPKVSRKSDIAEAFSGLGMIPPTQHTGADFSMLVSGSTVPTGSSRSSELLLTHNKNKFKSLTAPLLTSTDGVNHLVESHQHVNVLSN